ncbi:ferritin-like domain-containing protein [Gottfriedia acidiceleris]|uniref:ferritin-like domain-containing protein n=1 Tax=Gottfriedia acidiceleris TaxID=371036 RepID=UPI001F24FC8A|nr:ferritin-like domain-containing protein [Gottfriedia acidiceleris]
MFFLYYYNTYPQIKNLNQQLYYRYPIVSTSDQGTCQKVFEAILKGIQGEATAIEFYSRLAKIAPNQTAQEDVLHALEDEKVHLNEFTKLYVKMTGIQPNIQITPIQFNTFKEGLNIAYRDELEAYEFYRNVYLMTQNLTVRDVLLRGFTDEIEHATRFGFLLLNL